MPKNKHQLENYIKYAKYPNDRYQTVQPELVAIQNKFKTSISNPGGSTDTDVVDFLAQIARRLNPMRIFVIDIDELECTVFGNQRPYFFGTTIIRWTIKGCGFTSKFQYYCF